MVRKVKTGQGNVILSGPNSYTGDTYVVGGTLSVGAANALGGTLTILVSGGTLALGGFTPTVNGLQVGASDGSIAGSVTGTGYITNNTAPFDLRSGLVSSILTATRASARARPAS